MNTDTTITASLPARAPWEANDEPRFSVWLLECRYADGSVYILRPFTHNAGASETEAMARATQLEADCRAANGAFRPNCTLTLVSDGLLHSDALLVMDEEPAFRNRNWGGF